MNTLKQVTHYPDTNSVEATWIDEKGAVIKCHSYADVQMQMFRDDVAELGGDIVEYEDLIALVESNIKPVEPQTTEQIVEGFKSAIQNTLDEAARAKGYDDIISACSYAGYPNVFQAEAIAFGQWRATVWAYGYGELDKVIAGTRPVPTIAEILAELPSLVLP